MLDRIIKPEEAKLTRRDMLKAAGITAAGFALGQIVNSPVAYGSDVLKQPAEMPYPSGGVSESIIKDAMYWAAARHFYGQG